MLSEHEQPGGTEIRWPQPGELWSWAGMIELLAGDYTSIQRGIRKVEIQLADFVTRHEVFPRSVRIEESFLSNVNAFADQCGQMGMRLTAVSLRTIATNISEGNGCTFNAGEGAFSMGASPAAMYLEWLIDARKRFKDEVEGLRFLVIDPSKAPLYAQATPLFGNNVHANFESARYDIEEAGKCMALGRWTAAVLHLMRALEPALLALQAEVQAKTPKDQWQQMIDQIETAIEAMENDAKSKTSKHSRSATKEERAWFSDAAVHFRYMKDAWRNYAAHGKERYDEERAQRIYNNVRDFMIQLSGKLKEPT